MKIIWDGALETPCVAALGMFDGVHLGHRALLREGRWLADSLGLPLAVCTFEPHPLQVLCPERMPTRLTTFPERARLMAGCGVDILHVRSFTRALADQPPEDFIAALVEADRPRAVVCGYNFTFGREGRGDGSLLTAMGNALGFRVSVVPAVTAEGAPVSSTRIRGLLEGGQLETANRLLGHPYALSGRVVHGKQVGHALGFPTANLGVPGEKTLPAFGVYFGDFAVRGETWPAVVNIGRHPTFPEGDVTVEAHLLKSDGQALYGEPARLSLRHFHRPEQRFRQPEQLQAQIREDVEAACRWFGLK
ncbi:MAG: bifunctional riboflavin kinase/FAD synthetase [Clostridia bacterium]|nr:bifunctional riboflavin kinase/FAD synthetase [Clostridia bacterium]